MRLSLASFGKRANAFVAFRQSPKWHNAWVPHPYTLLLFVDGWEEDFNPASIQDNFSSMCSGR